MKIKSIYIYIYGTVKCNIEFLSIKTFTVVKCTYIEMLSSFRSK